MANDVPKSSFNTKGHPYKTDWDPIWPEDFYILQSLSKTAFLLWRILIATRENPEQISSICKTSDYEIQRITGFNRLTIRKARRELVSSGYIIPQGYHTCLIRNFKHFKGGTENVLPNKTKLDRKCPNNGTKNVLQLDRKCPIVGQKISHPIITNPDTDITDSKDLASPVENFSETARIDDSELPSLRSLYPFKDRENLKRHLMATRGFSEKQVSDTFERVYPLQYTGKAR